MNDTTPEAARIVRLLYQSRTPDERVRMACGMFDAAKALAIAGLRLTTPGISEADLRVAVFERFYGRDVDPSQRPAILERIREET